jgi:hypothetical protein
MQLLTLTSELHVEKDIILLGNYIPNKEPDNSK